MTATAASKQLAHVSKIWGKLTPDERVEVWRLVQAEGSLWLPLPGPQRLGYESEADVLGIGGAAGGGKTALIAGLSITRHQKVLVARHERVQCEGLIQYLLTVLGSYDGYNSQKGAWQVKVGSQPLIEFAGLADLGDESKWQGRDHDLLCLDEATEIRESQARFLLGWVRSAGAQRARVVMTFNPPRDAEGRWVLQFFAPWLDRRHPNPAKPGELRWFTQRGEQKDYEVPDSRPFVWTGEPDDLHPDYEFDPAEHTLEQIITPKSRTFIPSRVTDNPFYVASGYIAQLQQMEEPLRSQLLFGDFEAGILDSEWQVCPTAWVEAAMARWKRPDRLEPMDVVGVDVARGGRDKTVVARRHGMWFDQLLRLAGTESPDGYAVRGFVMQHLRDDAAIAIDVIGVGASPYDLLRQASQQVVGIVAGATATAAPLKGRLKFKNLRSQLWWQMREALDPANDTGICLPPDRKLLADLTAATWTPKGDALYVSSREEIKQVIGRSPDDASAVIMALMPIHKLRQIRDHLSAGRKTTLGYDPYAAL